MIKVCSKCKVEKEDSEFNKKKQSKDGLSSWCKNCFKEYKKENKHRLIDNKEKRKESRKKHYQNNKEKYKEVHIKYNEENKDKVKEYHKKYYQKNKEKINNKYRSYIEININFKLASYLRSRLRTALKKSYKSGSAVKDLGCSIEELKLHLESKFYPNPETSEQMNWENQGEWHIDHIIPLSSFDLTNREQFLKANHYTNLQPLWAKENLSKGNKIV